ncbi:AAA family ATPase [Novosphingobium sp. 1949]|uniref:AAA family ATPase n=1 Tax=Novosphingobium organovorum TaxID=2930092 RepID=A0ABT0B8Q5_9SPHN|nr:AAA family ATPase [Novosphingobium organovorum]MCJ2181408.1 AAA family ATPase [Novosphingobium organovorum]
MPNANSAPHDDQRDALAFLGDDAIWGEPVERIDTHGASVFLTGERAFKLKRAVRYPYLDFSTRERRRAMCLRELVLNRRTAPELYRAVRPLLRGGDGAVQLGPPISPACGGEAEHHVLDWPDALDWVIEMRRFAAHDLFDTLAHEGRLTPAMLRDLADAIARFHARADTVACTPPHAAADRVRAVIEGNRASMAATGPDILPPQECDALLALSLGALEGCAPILEARGGRGLVRLGHGDLHLGNICLWEGRPTLFDCLEFDDELASGDVLYDLAFLVMDLWHRGERDGAALVFNRYLDMTDTDGEAFAVMPLFLSMRAAVRAHVNASAALRIEAPDARQARVTEARRYLARARDFLRPDSARVVAVGGVSGSGKSTLSAQLAAHLGGAAGARWLRTDVLRKRMAGQAPETPLPPQAYTRASSQAVYARMLAAADAVLRHGGSVLMDGVFADPDERRAVEDLAQAHRARFDGLWLTAERAVLAERIAQRRGDASDANVAVLDQQLSGTPGDLTGWHGVESAAERGTLREKAFAVLGLAPC